MTRRIAAALLRDERTWHTLQATELVHEAWLRLAATLASELSELDQTRTRSLFAKVMRQVLVDHARVRAAQKRSGVVQDVPIHAATMLHGGSSGMVMVQSPDEIFERLDDTLLVDSLLRELSENDPRASHVVELRYFAGLTIQQTAIALSVSDFVVEKDWRIAKAWMALRVQQHRGG